MKVKLRIIGITLLLLMVTFETTAQSRLGANEASFYTNRIGPQRKMLRLTGANNGNDSRTLNNEITRMSNQGGGIIRLLKPNNRPYIYLRNVALKNKVHIKIASNVTLRPWFGGSRPKNVSIFDFGLTSRIRDVAITCERENSTNSNDYFKVLLSGGSSERTTMVFSHAVTNFKISGIKFTDSNTVFSNLEFNLNSTQSRAAGDISNKGLVKNIISFKNHVGYGIVQVRAGKNILFKNLEGEGGVTLRIESGFIPAIRSKQATIDRIVGRNITVRKGDAAVMLSPHRVNQGRVDVSGIKAFNSTVAAQIEGGFLDKKGGVNNLGTFKTNSFIGDFKQIRGGNNAQVKSKDYPL